MIKSKKIRYFEVSIYTFIILISVSIPLFMRFEDGREWNFIFRSWVKLVPFFVIFLINNYILAPRLLLKNKFPTYIIACIILLVSVSFLDNLLIKQHFPRPNVNMQQIHEGAPCNIPLPGGFEKPPLKDLGNNPMPHMPRNRPLPPTNTFFNLTVLIIGLLIIGFNSGMKIFIYWIKEQNERSEKEKQYLTTELAFLRQQVSPHFFMNTLNNIHALVDIDSERSKDAIIKLSKLMRYLLYETDTEKISLNKEIEFLESFVELMRLRYDETKLSVDITYSGNVDNTYVPSLLFLPFVENAFKHGIGNDKKSFVDIQFKIHDDNLIFTIKNSNFSKKSTEFEEASGIGLENIRKRLNLIYKNNYLLLINSNHDVYEVSLAVPLEKQNIADDDKMHDIGR